MLRQDRLQLDADDEHAESSLSPQPAAAVVATARVGVLGFLGLPAEAKSALRKLASRAPGDAGDGAAIDAASGVRLFLRPLSPLRIEPHLAFFVFFSGGG